MKSNIALLIFTLVASLSACGPTSNNADGGTTGGFDVIVTGEGAATDGIAFPAASDGDPFFQDGWAFTFTNVVVFVDHLAISENPDRSPGDQSQTGDLVAQADGPWVVDLAKAGPVSSKEMNGLAWPVTTIANQNKKGGAAFDPTQKYAFGFDLVTASTAATAVNSVDQAVISNMVAKGWSVWLNGYAEFKGTSCRSTVATYDFGRLPKRVNFSFGFAMPTTYKNCVNPDLLPEGSRGIQSVRGQNATAQITFHLDHPFWEALQEDAPLRFDLIAAQKSVATGPGAAAVSVTEADLQGVRFQGATDAQGTALPWRYCGPPQSSERTTGTVSYDPKGVPVNPLGGAAGLKDVGDYMRYNLSTFGHLNNDGLCFPSRNFSAP